MAFHNPGIGHQPVDQVLREWRLPFAMRQINDAQPGHEGPSCPACASYQADRERRAEQSPMLHGSDNKLYTSPHAGTYLFEARYSRWACTQGAHGPLDQTAGGHDGGAACCY
ncbi:hypothetical protein F4553_005306 [Allocatelliglobosispora scoriae]|uniref:Uncharacterized protein n=1 Tax=Allocatelliglobosispora scoriae TaxID=643052 RepID=A0A841BS94_9ACTN|nr:hypothetical protein [Allocatelliglobosispora scoriae]MBB5871927.1 hypothetical protein [Allocatelliglobosispora scoriae]